MLQKEAGRGAESRLARVSELADRLRQTTDRIDAVFQEFLYVAKPEGLAPEPVEVNAALRDCLDLLAPRLETAGTALPRRAERPRP